MYICTITFTHYKHPGVDCQISTLQRKLNLKNKSNQYSVGYLCWMLSHNPPTTSTPGMDASDVPVVPSPRFEPAPGFELKVAWMGSPRSRREWKLAWKWTSQIALNMVATVGRKFWGLSFPTRKSNLDTKNGGFAKQLVSFDISSCTEGASSSAMYRRSSVVSSFWCKL